MSTFKKSPLDKVSDLLSPAIRKVGDFHITLTGTQTSIMRITKKSDEAFAGQDYDVFGDFDQKFAAQMMNNVIIKYPFNDIQIFVDKYNEIGIDTQVSDFNSFDITELLPIEMVVQFNGDYQTDPIVMIKGDIVVDVVYDENKNKIPVIMEITKMRATMFAKNIVRKVADLSLHRGPLEKEIMDRIKQYIASL